MSRERIFEYGAVFVLLVIISDVFDFALAGHLHPLANVATGLVGAAAVWTMRVWFRQRHQPEEDDW